MQRGSGSIVWSVAVGVGALVLVFAFCLAGGGALADTGATSSSTGAAATITGPIAPGRPCADPVETQGYGPTPYAFEPPQRGYAHFHTGIDFVCMGDRGLHAILPGVVFSVVRSNCRGGFGCNVVIESTIGGHLLYSRYGHGAEGSQLVAVGEPVALGQPLELEGSTGNSTGAHVHFEVDDGTPFTSSSIDPTSFVDPSIVRS